MSYDGDEGDYGWDTYMDRLIAREEAQIRGELEAGRQLELAYFYPEIETVQTNPDYL